MQESHLYIHWPTHMDRVVSIVTILQAMQGPQYFNIVYANKPRPMNRKQYCRLLICNGNKRYVYSEGRMHISHMEQ